MNLNGHSICSATLRHESTLMPAIEPSLSM
jgi:hypothetical protein